MTERMIFFSCLGYCILTVACAGSQKPRKTIATLTPQTTTQSQTSTLVDSLGGLRLGISYDEFKTRSGFEDDPKRDDPEKNLKAAKIVGPLLGKKQVLQRLFFQDGKLMKITIIFFPQSLVTRDEAIAMVSKEWGEPEINKSELTVWKGLVGAILIKGANEDKSMPIWLVSLDLL